MSKKEKKQLYRILIAAAGFIAAALIGAEGITAFIIYLIVYIIIGGDVLLKAARNILRGQVFDENFLMSIATIGAFCLAEYSEGVAVMLFYQVGELFQSYAVSKSRRSISDLMDIRPDFANVLRNGKIITMDPEEVAIGEIITVKPGERIPLDGRITEGSSRIDTSALTGESLPRDVQVDDEVISGCINQSGVLQVEVTKEFGESTVAKILDLVENSAAKKSKSENFITKFARYYTPAVVAAAVLLALLPPLFTGGEFQVWISRALTFLVISCPCALVISIPLSFFGGIGGASRAGILIKGSNYLEALADTEIVVFDKTGTLTKGSFAVSEINAVGYERDQLLEYAAYAEKYSTHPIGLSIQKAYNKPIDPKRVSDITELSGYGVKAVVDGAVILAGNEKLMKNEGILLPAMPGFGTAVYLAVNHSYAGYILIEDELKEDSKQAIAELKKAGIKKTVMLTGDSDGAGQKAASALGIDKVYTELLPADKVMHMEELMHQRGQKGKLAFVGDGINDAPVLARADIGIAMGGLGSDAAIEAADIVIMTDEPSKLTSAIRISKKTLKIVRQNIVFALGVKGIVLILGAFGLASMWAAVFSDVGVSVLAILNAMRALKSK